MHIGGFKYKRDEFKIWCSTHIKEAEQGAVIFKYREGNKNIRVAIKGPEVGGDGDNSPNTASDCKETIVGS
jgi:hypothetical protein